MENISGAVGGIGVLITLVANVAEGAMTRARGRSGGYR